MLASIVDVISCQMLSQINDIPCANFANVFLTNVTVFVFDFVLVCSRNP